MIRTGKQRSLERVVDGFSKARILVVGDIMMDRFIWGKVSRISPEAPVPVVVVERETLLLGGAANVVNNIRSLGGRVSLCGVVGNDETGQKIGGMLNERGIETQGVFVEPARQTTVKTRVIAHQQQVVRIDRETTDSLNRSTVHGLSTFIKENMEDFDAVILSDYEKGLLTEKLIRAIVRKGHEVRKSIIVDPKLRNFFSFRGVKVVTPNTAEASAASGIAITDRRSLEKAGRLLLNRLKCEALVITRGEEGMAIFEPDEEPFLVPTVAKEVYDVTGAGDTAIGTLALALAAGANVREAVRLANYSAGIVVGKRGTATVRRDELVKVIREMA